MEVAEANEIQALLDALDPATRTLVAEVDLGEQTKAFCNSDLGKHFIGCAHQEIADAQNQLARTMPWRRRKIQELQNRIWRAEFLLSWLRELLVTGQSARSALQEAEHG